MHILIEEYALLRERQFKLKIPNDFAEIRKEYIEDNDPIQQFITDHLIKTNNDTDIIKSSDMFDRFKKEMGEKAYGISSIIFKDIMVNKQIPWKKTSAARIFYRIKFQQEEAENGIF
jgi:hypothetical protein